MNRILKTIVAIMLMMVFALGCTKPDEPNNGASVSGSIEGHDYVDLGLPSGTLWATCNVGADTPEDYGDYFAWGEIVSKTSYLWTNYSFAYDRTQLTKYCLNPIYGYQGFADSLTTLETCDDAAAANWGGGWRMPSYAEWREMINNCWLDGPHINGVNDWAFVGNNGNRLVLPFASFKEGTSNGGYVGYYWSSTLYTDQPDCARLFYMEGNEYMMSFDPRSLGLTVRPVHSPE